MKSGLLLKCREEETGIYKHSVQDVRRGEV